MPFIPHQNVVIESAMPFPMLLTLEASVSENHARKAEVTAHPVEVGSDMADHSRFLPRTLDMVGIVSNTPIVFLASLRALPSVAGGDPSSRAEDAFQALEQVMRTGTLCFIDTTLASYENMMLESLAAPRDATRGNIVELQMSWREVRIAETTRVQMTPKIGRINLGKKIAKAAKQAEAAKAVSILAKVKALFLG